MKTSFDTNRDQSMEASAKGLGDRTAAASERLAHAAGAGDHGLPDGSTTATLKDQAAQAAQQAKHTVTAMADEARHRITEIIDQQKIAGADQVAGVAKAAQAAAGDLQQTSPQLAKLVRAAAESVDHVADDIRSSDLADLLGSLSDFGRRRPVAFFGGAVLAGFLLTRFLKSDAPGRASDDAHPGPIA
ncbi:MAG TPA: hypothetical protein VH414_22360 [Lichenihabitans sp.]|nr:hypothetical protein [Lichenihabitans sp.]